MKKKTTSSLMRKLIIHFGGDDTCHGRKRGVEIVAGKLDCDESWAYKISKGSGKPGKSLWKLMRQLEEEISEEGDE